MKKTTLLALAAGGMLSLVSPTASAQEGTGIIKIPISAEAVVIEDTTDAVEEEEDDSAALEEATTLFKAAPQSVQNFCIYYFASFYGCMGQTVVAQGIDSIQQSSFDIYVDQIIYSNTPVEIIVAMPTEYQQYFVSLKNIWDKAAEQASALGEDASEEDYETILEAAYDSETQLTEKYEEASAFMEAVLPYLSTILNAEAEVDSKLEAAGLNGDYSEDKDNYAKVLDLMSDSIYALLK